MYWRSRIRAGDTTTVGGNVQPKPQIRPETENGEMTAYEGDPVWCLACSTHGMTKCVQPYRVNTDPSGRQRLLDGDLCLCKCSEPPRLIARSDWSRDGFTPAEIWRRMPYCADWVEYAKLGDQFQQDAEALNGGKLFSFVDSETGEPLANRGFVVNEGGVLREARTNKNGIAIIQAALGVEVTIHLVFSSPMGEMKFEG